MNTATHRRPHHRVGEKNVKQQNEEKSLIEFDIKKTTLVVAIFCFLQGCLLGMALKRK